MSLITDAPTSFVEHSHPEHRAEMFDREKSQGEMLVGTARRIRDWQKAQKPAISDAALCRRFAGLGSDKTFRKIRTGDLDSLTVPNHLAKYRGVWAQIEILAGSAPSEEIYEDLQPALETGVAVASLIPQQGKTRLLLIEGPSGTGKTESLRLAAARFPGSVVLVEAHEGWSSVTCALRDLLFAVDPTAKGGDAPKYKADLLAALIRSLNAKRLTLCIDEGHHASAAVLNVIKTLLNQTPVLIVVAAIGTLWRKLTLRTWEEACQLIHNRLHDRVILSRPSHDDAELFLSRRIPGLVESEGWQAAVPKLAEMANTSGHFAFLRDIATAANQSTPSPTASELLAIAVGLQKTKNARFLG